MATKLVQKYSDILKGTVPAPKEEPKKEVGEDNFELYREYEKEKKSFDVIFSFIDTNGDLITKDASGITLILKGDDLSKELSYYNEKRRGLYLGSPFTVKVQSIDEENKIVHVKNGRSQKSSVKNQIIREIMRDIKGGKPLKIVGRVVQVNKKKVLVDILGKGILGICEVKHWMKGYIRYLDEACKPGDVLEFDITGVLPKENHDQIAFSLSREEYTEDPWTLIPAEVAKPEAVIVVRCIDVPDRTGHWWGVSTMVPGIEIMGDFTKRFDKLKMVRGAKYKCKIVQAELENHIFKVVPFEVADEDADTVNAIRIKKVVKKI